MQNKYTNIRYRLIFILALVGINYISAFGQATNIIDYHLPGTYTYIVPQGVTELVIECWGGGGGGSAAIGMKQPNSSNGAGGGGGAHAHSVIKVVTGQTFTFIVGAGGEGGTDPYTLGKGNGKNGGITTFYRVQSEPLVYAEGGYGATFALQNIGGSKGGSGGSYSGSKGTVIHAGGNGADAGINFSGGGGGAAGRTHGGYNAVGITAGGAGSCYCGIPGAGGMGRNTSGDGNPGINTENVNRGVIYGSGGGAGAYDSEYQTKNGGKGANGHVRIKEQQTLGNITGKTYIEIGETTQLIAPVAGGNWRSSLTEVAVIDLTGLVTAISPGETVISYSMGDFLTAQSTEVHLFVYPKGQGIAITGQRSYCDDGATNIDLQASMQNSQGYAWHWTGPGGFTLGASGIDRRAIPQNAGTYTVTASKIVGSNIVKNGNFEQGKTTDIQSDYGYNEWSQGTGIYNINTKPLNPNFNQTCGDHTSGSGKYMSLQGKSSIVGNVWMQNVTVEKNTYYQFSFWMQAIQQNSENSSTTIEMLARVGGDNVGEVFKMTTKKECSGWRQFVGNWYSGNKTSIQLALKLNKQMGDTYNVGLDDISFFKISNDPNSIISSSVNVTVGAFTPTVQIIPVPLIPIEGRENRFIASTDNAGQDPKFAWYVNDFEVQKGRSLTYASSSLLVGDKVKCKVEINANFSCATEQTVWSDEIVVQAGAEKVNYWVGIVNNKWYALDNWSRRRVPKVGEDIIFATEDTYGSNAISDLEVSAKPENLNIDEFVQVRNYTNHSGKGLIIAPGGYFNIAGDIDIDNSHQIEIATSEIRLSGTLIISNEVAEAPLVTVEMWSKASIDTNQSANNQIKWQYFGLPVKQTVASPTFDGAYIRKYDESKATSAPGSQWTQLNNSSVIQQFDGYEIAQPSPKRYEISGQLVRSDFERTLSKTTGSYYKGQHIFANSYTAAMDISKLLFGDGLEKTVYLYNTGSYAHWSEGIIGWEQPGSYIAIPQEQAQWVGQSQIPSMQGFLIRVLDEVSEGAGGSNCKIEYKYADLVANNSNTRSQRYKTNKAFIEIKLSSHHYRDIAFIFEEAQCTPGFDNGWDGRKLLSASVAQMFVTSGSELFQVSSTNKVEGTTIGVIAGDKDVDYTLELNLKDIGILNRLYLVDNKTKSRVALREGVNRYNFGMTTGESATTRFKITSQIEDIIHPESNKGDIRVHARDGYVVLTNMRNHGGVASIIDSVGKVLVHRKPFVSMGTTTIASSLSPGAYIVTIEGNDGVEVEKVLVR